MATKTLYIDTQRQGQGFLFEATEGSTPSLRVYISANGSDITLESGDEGVFTYAYSRTASSFTSVAGVANVGSNFIDFEFTALETATRGKYFASIFVDNIVQTDGILTLKANGAI